ncbi:MAG: hypothetical protein JO234_06495, partial [Hyphomicrobiales bacterium]|nr:hypothetical protein [Hyphomicrobiales bacterium]
YPGLAKLPDDRPGAPLGNVFADNLADRAPVIAYDRPETAALGEESGNRAIPAGGEPDGALPPLPDDAPAAASLRATEARVAATEQATHALRFRARAEP